MIAFIDDHRDRHGVEPARRCERVKRDEARRPQIRRVFDADGLVLAARKVRRQLRHHPGRDDQWPLRDGLHPPSRSLAQLLGRRTRTPRTGRMVQQPTVLQPIAHTQPSEAEASYSTALGTRAMAAELNQSASANPGAVQSVCRGRTNTFHRSRCLRPTCTGRTQPASFNADRK